jgi:hypothetical protein
MEGFTRQFSELALPNVDGRGQKTPVPLYSTLPSPTATRMLHVLPAAANVDGRICCVIEVVDLDDRPGYTALSYTWGDPFPVEEHLRDHSDANAMPIGQKFEITINNMCMKVTESCYTFLEQFQHLKSIIHDPRYHGGLEPSDVESLWVDAISIDQSSLEERAAQVKIMDRIYKQARKVIIWLGPADSMTRPALYALSALAKVPRERWWQVNSGTGMFDPRTYELLGIPQISIEQWKAVRALYRRSWFSRAWTIQEAVLARDAVVQCGSLQVSFDMIFNLAGLLAGMGWTMYLETMDSSTISENVANTIDVDRHNTQIEPQQISATSEAIQPVPTPRKTGTRALVTTWHPITTLGMLRDMQEVIHCRVDDDPYPLQVVLHATSSAESTDPADKVYAVLGLVSKASWKDLPVDYSLTTVEVYTQATHAIMRVSQNLRMLSFVEDKKYRNIAGLPSWVPDFTARRSKMPMDWGGNKEDWIATMGDRAVQFDASHGLHFEGGAESNKSSVRLSVKGQFYGIVETITPFWFPPFTTSTAVENILNTLQRLPKDHYWKTVIADEHLVRYSTNNTKVEWLRAQPSDELTFILILQEEIYNLYLEYRQAAREMSLANDGVNVFLEKQRQFKRGYEILKAVVPDDMIAVFLKQHAEELNSIDADESAKSCQVWKSSLDETSQTRLRFQVSVLPRLLMRTLFTIKELGLGNGLESTRAGDEVWVLAGGRVPYVLRPKGNNEYELVGEAYVHGIMDGELFANSADALTAVTLV